MRLANRHATLHVTPTQRLLRLGWVIIRLVLVIVLILAINEPRWMMIPALLTQANAMAQSGKFTPTLSLLQTALDYAPNTPLLFQRLVDTYNHVNRPDAAIVTLQRWAAARGWSPDLFRQVAQILTNQGDYDAAAPYWLASLPTTSSSTDSAPAEGLNSIPAWRALATLALARQDWESARTMLGKLLTYAPQDTAALYNLGLLLMPDQPSLGLAYLQQSASNPAYQGTLTTLSQVISTYRNDPPSTLAFRMGLTMLNANAYPQAEYALKTALSAGFNDPVVYAYLGITQDQQGRDGMQMIQRAIDLASDNATVQYLRAVHWRLRGDTQQALAALTLAGTLDPRNAAIAAELGTNLRDAGQFREAIQWLTLAVSLAPDDHEFAVLLANFFADQNWELSTTAISVIEPLQQKYPTDVDIIASLAWAYVAAGRADDAQRLFDQGMALNPSQPRLRFYLGLWFEQRGDRDQATQNLLFVYHQTQSPRFSDLAIRVLQRMGYKPTVEELIQDQAAP